MNEWMAHLCFSMNMEEKSLQWKSFRFRHKWLTSSSALQFTILKKELTSLWQWTDSLLGRIYLLSNQLLLGSPIPLTSAKIVAKCWQTWLQWFLSTDPLPWDFATSPIRMRVDFLALDSGLALWFASSSRMWGNWQCGSLWALFSCGLSFLPLPCDESHICLLDTGGPAVSQQ